MQDITLNINIQLGSNYYSHTKEDLESIAYCLIADYLNVRKDEQYSDEEQFDVENGYIIGDYEINVI